MVFGVLKDIKNGEYRVIVTPSEAASIAADGHEVLIQKGAGEKAGFEDEDYEKAGAVLVETAEELYARCVHLHPPGGPPGGGAGSFG